MNAGSRPVTALTWRQVNAWRLSQHCLSQRLERRRLVEAVTRTGGIQAQVMSAAELALWARVIGLSPQDVRSALWQDRTLLKTWAMRATLHLISASDLPLYVAARSVYEGRNWPYYFSYHGISQPLYEAFLNAVPQILGNEPMTREQLAAAVAEQIGSAALRSLILEKGWGTPLKPSAWRGDLCFGPNKGQNVTFVRPSAWLGEWQQVEPYAALQEIARRYLRAYGPATPEDFARWWWGGQGIALTRKLFKSLDDELEPVEVKGWGAVALRETLEPMQALESPGTVNLVPLFDAYAVGLGRGAELEPVLARAYQSQVYRPQGWISAVVLVDGVMKGVWEHERRSQQTAVKIRMFAPLTVSIRNGIEAEVERLGVFLNSKIAVEYEGAA